MAPSESSASPEPRCEPSPNVCAICGGDRCPWCRGVGAEHDSRRYDAPPSAPGGSGTLAPARSRQTIAAHSSSSRHSDGAAPTERPPWPFHIEDAVRAVHYGVEGRDCPYDHPERCPYERDADRYIEAHLAWLSAQGYLVHKSSPAIPEGRWVYLHLPDGTPTASDVPDDRAVLESRVRALLVEQIAAAIEALPPQCGRHERNDDKDCDACILVRAVRTDREGTARVVRSFATPGDDHED